MFPLVTPVTGVDAASDDAREVGVEVKRVFTGVVVAGVAAADDFTGDSGILFCASFDLLLSIAVVAFVVVVKFCLLLLLLLDVSEDVVVDTVIEFVTPPELLLLLLTAVVGVVVVEFVVADVLLLVITAAELTTGVTVISRVIVGAAVVETEDCSGCTAKLVIASNGFGGGCNVEAVDSGPDDRV